MHRIKQPFTANISLRWPNGWEGGYVEGHEQVKDYWTRQWKELNPHVQPISFAEKESGQIEVDVHQLVKNMLGNVLFDGLVRHIYTVEDGWIKSMETEKL